MGAVCFNITISMQTFNFESFLSNLNAEPCFVMNPNMAKSDYLFLDLSRANKTLSSVNVATSTALQAYIQSQLDKQQKQVAYGGYLEKRNIYRRSAYFNVPEYKAERYIHLGVDFWMAAGSKVYAPVDGVVHSFKNNTNFGDYGPTIILEHTFNMVKFYTLYGHLSLSSLQNISVGHFFKAGDLLGTLGTANENGDYPPHLHFQIIKDLQGSRGDYPGVCSRETVDFYKQNCPDPNLLLKIVS